MADPIVTPPHPPVSVPPPLTVDPLEGTPLAVTVALNPPMVGVASPFIRVDGQNRDLVLESIRAWARGPLIDWAKSWQSDLTEWGNENQSDLTTWADAWRTDLIKWLTDTDNWLDAWNADVVRYVTENVEEITEFVDTEVANAKAYVDTEVANAKAYVDTEVAEAKAHVDEVLEQVINDSIEVQDPVMAGILGSGESITRGVTDSIYGRGRSLAEFGAIGDGVVDDTAAIVAAIAAVSAQGGGQLYMPPGVYLSDPFTVPAGITFIGDQAATFKARSAGLVFVTLTGSQITFNGVKIDGDNKVTSWLVDTHRDVAAVSFINSELCGVSGTTTLALLRMRDGCNDWTITNSHLHHATSTTIGRLILIGDSQGTVRGVKFAQNRFNDVYPNADGDAIVIQDFTLNVDVGIENNTFRDCSKRAIKIQCGGVRAVNNDIEIGTTVTRAYCAIAVYASDAIVSNNAIRGHYSTCYIEIGAGPQLLKNVTVTDNNIYGDAANRGPSCDGIVSLGEGLTDSTIVARVANVRHGVRLENVLKNVSVSGIMSGLSGSAVILDDNDTVGSTARQMKNIVIPWLVLDAITNYAVHTNGGNAPGNLAIGTMSGIANFGKFGGNIAAGVRASFYEKNPIAKPTVSGNLADGGPALNSLIVRLVDLGLIADGRA